jgi:GTP1/Obg family GTP-binding protein
LRLQAHIEGTNIFNDGINLDLHWVRAKGRKIIKSEPELSILHIFSSKLIKILVRDTDSLRKSVAEVHV